MRKRDISNADIIALAHDLGGENMDSQRGILDKHNLDFDALVGRVWKLAKAQGRSSDRLTGHIGDDLIAASQSGSQAALECALRRFHLTVDDELAILDEARKRKTPQDIRGTPINVANDS